jgi:hypothetical protein
MRSELPLVYSFVGLLNICEWWIWWELVISDPNRLIKLRLLRFRLQYHVHVHVQLKLLFLRPFLQRTRTPPATSCASRQIPATSTGINEAPTKRQRHLETSPNRSRHIQASRSRYEEHSTRVYRYHRHVVTRGHFDDLFMFVFFIRKMNTTVVVASFPARAKQWLLFSVSKCTIVKLPIAVSACSAIS